MRFSVHLELRAVYGALISPLGFVNRSIRKLNNNEVRQIVGKVTLDIHYHAVGSEIGQTLHLAAYHPFQVCMAASGSGIC